MTSLIRLLLVLGWIVGAATTGYTVESEAPATRQALYVVSHTECPSLSKQGERIVIRVGIGRSRWRLAAPTPEFVTEWLRSVKDSAPGVAETAPRESTTFIPL